MHKLSGALTGQCREGPCPQRALSGRAAAGGKPGLAKGEDEVGGRLPSRRVRGGPRKGPQCRHQGPASLPGTRPGTWSMSSRAWPEEPAALGSSSPPDTNDPLPGWERRTGRPGGRAQRFLPQGCLQGRRACSYPPPPPPGWGGPAWPLQVPHRLTLTHTHRVTPRGHKSPRTTHGEHTGTQSAHGPQGGDHRGLAQGPPAWEGCVRAEPHIPCSQWVLGALCDQEPAQAGRRAGSPNSQGGTGLGSERPGELLRSHGGQRLARGPAPRPSTPEGSVARPGAAVQEQGGWATAALAPQCWPGRLRGGELGLRRKEPAASGVVTEQAL